MNKHLLKANKIASKALGLFESAVKGLEEANEVLKKGSKVAEGNVLEINQDIIKLEEEKVEAKMVVQQHDMEILKNSKTIDKLRELIGA